MENLFVFLALFGGPLLGIAVGGVYLAKAGSHSTLALRIATSAFGPAVALMFVLSELFWPDQYRFNTQKSGIYIWLQVFPLLLLFFTLAKYPGPRKIHLLLVPLGVFAWGWSFAVGWMLINGK